MRVLTSPWRIGFCLSFLLHAVVLFPSPSQLFLRPAEYAVQLQNGSVELYLVAAPPSEASLKDQDQASAPNQNSDVLIQAGSPNATHPVGDGSSSHPGLDKTSAYFPPMAQVNGKPGAFGNRPPLYPEVARKLGQQGKVLLSVRVDRAGLPVEVDIQKSSNFPLLDEAALSAVRQWKFRPGRIGVLPMESVVKIPIRFVIEDN